jgi:hypothetical protein
MPLTTVQKCAIFRITETTEDDINKWLASENPNIVSTTSSGNFVVVFYHGKLGA